MTPAITGVTKIRKDITKEIGKTFQAWTDWKMSLKRPLPFNLFKIRHLVLRTLQIAERRWVEPLHLAT